MSLELWRENGWLREYRTSPQEIADILDLVERDLEDAASRNSGQHETTSTPAAEKETSVSMTRWARYP